jgi:hypothetical protein
MLTPPVPKILIGLVAIGVGFLAGRLALAAANSPREVAVLEAVGTLDPASREPAEPAAASPAQTTNATTAVASVASAATPAPVAVTNPAAAGPANATPAAQAPVQHTATAAPARPPKRRLANRHGRREIRLDGDEADLCAIFDDEEQRVHVRTPFGHLSF